MDLSSLHWGSPVGLGLFFVGIGICCWCLSTGIAAVMRANHPSNPKSEQDDSARKRQE